MTLAIQTHLRSVGTFADLLAKHGVKSKPHPTMPLTSFCYDQIASKPTEPEVLAAFPEYAEIVRKVQAAYTGLITDASLAYAKHRDIPVQKDFAAAIKTVLGHHALFAVRNGKSPSVVEYFRNARVDMVLDLLGYQDEPEAEAAQ